MADGFWCETRRRSTQLCPSTNTLLTLCIHRCRARPASCVHARLTRDAAKAVTASIVGNRLDYYLRQRGYVFVVVCLFVCLLTTLRKNFLTDLHEIVREGRQWTSEWLNFGGDPDHCLDREIVFRIRHYWEIRKVVNGRKSAAHTDSPDGGTGIRRALAEVCTVHSQYSTSSWSIAVSVSVCMTLRSLISKMTCPNFTKFSAHITCDCGSALFWRQCNTLCTSGLLMM